MIESKPISIGNVSYVLGMSSKKLQRWYQQVLSGFAQAKNDGTIDKHNLSIEEQEKVRKIVVPIFKEENLGNQMAVDEKNINGTGYTILSNRQTNKIALMASTFKTDELMQIIEKFDIEKRMQVKSLSRDMASNYDWLGRQAFMNAYHIIDKFHVIKNLMEQLQAIRIRYRQSELAKRREANQSKQKYIETKLSNGDTILQLLARSRNLLFKLPDKWSEQQKQRAQVLFGLYPEIKTAFYLVLKIRKWFTPPKEKLVYPVTKNHKKEQLNNLLDELIETGIEEMKNMASLLKRNAGQIVNYFINKETNAKAEALNRNLQRFINMNYGTRNVDFFLYRIKIHFA